MAGRVLVAREGSFSHPLLWASSLSHALLCRVIGKLAFYSWRINVSEQRVKLAIRKQSLRAWDFFIFLSFLS